jgi:hypothetical protein
MVNVNIGKFYSYFKIYLNISSFNSFKKQLYRCAAKSGQINSAIILFSTIAIVLTMILFCYISILKKIHKTINFLRSTSNQDDRTSNTRNENTTDDDRISVLDQYRYSEVERKATKKILSYITMFILQWIPMSISQGARLVLVRDYINLEIKYFIYLFIYFDYIYSLPFF